MSSYLLLLALTPVLSSFSMLLLCCRLQLLSAKDGVESLRGMTGDIISSSDLAELTRSAQAVEARSQELASKQAQSLEQVSEELLCSPEIVRYSLLSRLELPPC